MKKCSVCQEEKSELEFSYKNKSKNKLQNKCKECFKKYTRQHYINNKDTYIKNAKINRANTYKRFREFLINIKNVPCKDCGKQFPHWIMEFDHIKDKKFCIPRWHGSKESLLEELEKCEVVCANCHSNRTYLRRIKYT